ncbi:MAG: polyphosphate kinase 1 [Eubacteriales bacterium]|jgi:polyphosphate kinase
MGEHNPREIYVNRELSWLLFNGRVLEEAENAHTPLYERLKFVAIFANNLDEFYMVRVGSLYDQTLLADPVYDSKTGMTSQEQLEKIYAATRELMPRRDSAYHQIMGELKTRGIRQVNFADMLPQEKEYLDTYFETQVLPLLSPQIIDKQHPFPFFENKKLYICVNLTAKNGKSKLGVVPLDGYLDRIIPVPAQEGYTFALAEEMLLHQAKHIFSGYTVQEKCVFRVTRNADIDVDDNMVDTDLDYREAMAELLKKRKRLVPVRLELSCSMSQEVTMHLCEKLNLSKNQVFCNSAPLDMSFIFAMEDRLKDPALFFPPLKPQPSVDVLDSVPMVDQILKKDVLLHYPYQDIKPLIRLLEESAVDPKVVSIKMTLYRVANNSKIVSALIKAAENGKDVGVVVELKARFDEANNIDWSKRLEEAGCTVVYGVDGYKVHSKLMLIVRKNGPHIQYISHVGTGNFNEKTAKIYTDLSLLTSSREIGSEVSNTFNHLFLGQTVDSTEHLLVAPNSFKNKIITLIDQEIAAARSGEKAQIILKMNSLTDKTLINKLIEASRNGVKIRMIVRGICCFRTGVKGYTDNIRVISIVGRFLEHSRIYVFGIGQRRKIYISSADFMTRNTERRVEVAAPIYDRAIGDRLMYILQVMFQDNEKARVQMPDGTFVHQTIEGEHHNAQEYFYKMAYEQAKQHQQQPHSKKERTHTGLQGLLRKLLKSK